MSSISQDTSPKGAENPSNTNHNRLANLSDVSGNPLFVGGSIYKNDMKDHPKIGKSLQMVCDWSEKDEIINMLKKNNLPTNLKKEVLTDEDADNIENNIKEHTYFYDHKECECFEFWKEWEEILPHKWKPYSGSPFKFIAKLEKEYDNIPNCCKKIMIETEILSPPNTSSLNHSYNNEIDTETNSKDEKSSSE